MNEMDETRSHVASEWQRAWVYRWSQDAPAGAAYSRLKSQLGAFFFALSTYADWQTGENFQRPPSRDTLMSVLGVGKERIPLLYEAAEALGVIRLRRGPGGKRVMGYALQMPLGNVLSWERAAAVLREDRRAKARFEERVSAADVPNETSAADTLRESAVPKGVRGGRSEDHADEQRASADTQKGVRGHSEGRPRRTRPLNDPPQPPVAEAVPTVQTPARAPEQDGIPEVEQRIVPVDVRPAQWPAPKTQQQGAVPRPAVERLKLGTAQERLAARFGAMRSDDEILRLVNTMRGHMLTDRERARYADVLVPESQRKYGAGTVGA